MVKRKFVVVLLVLLFSCIAVYFSMYTNDKLDRLNPFVKEQLSYAKVPNHENIEELRGQALVDAQRYEGIQSYDEKGRGNSYLLTFTGYDPSQKYVKIRHKGKWVYHIEYISENEYDKKINQY